MAVQGFVVQTELVLFLEESACCLQETVLIMAVWEEGGWTKQDDQQGGV